MVYFRAYSVSNQIQFLVIRFIKSLVQWNLFCLFFLLDYVSLKVIFFKSVLEGSTLRTSENMEYNSIMHWTLVSKFLILDHHLKVSFSSLFSPSLFFCWVWARMFYHVHFFVWGIIWGIILLYCSNLSNINEDLLFFEKEMFSPRQGLCPTISPP